MKNLWKYLPLIVMLFCLTACSDDDEDNNVAWANIEGTYYGYTSSTFIYTSVPIIYEDETLTIKVNSDGSVDMELISTMWNTKIEKAIVSSSGNDYTIQGSAVATLANHSDEVQDYQGQATATISKDKKDVSLTISLPSVMGGTTITFLNTTAPTSSLIQGSYSGTMNMKFAYGELDYEDQTITVEANGDDMVNISYSSDDVGNTNLIGIPISRNGNTITIEQTDGEFSMPTHSGGVSSYPCIISGEISSDQTEYTFIIELPGVMGGTTLTLKSN